MSFRKPVYISSSTIVQTRGGQDIKVYSKPVKYYFNVHSIDNSYTGGNSSREIYGTKITDIQQAIVSNRYDGMFKQGDIAYLDGVTPNSDNTNYNYIITSVRLINQSIAIYFERMQK